MKHYLSLIYFLSIVAVLCLSITLGLQTAAAAPNNAYMALPEGAKARLGKGSIRELAYTPDGDHLIVACSIGIWTYDAHTTKTLDLFNTSLSNRRTTFSPDRRMLATARGDDEKTLVHLWDLTNRQQTAILTGHTRYIESITFSPDGKTSQPRVQTTQFGCGTLTLGRTKRPLLDTQKV